MGSLHCFVPPPLSSPTRNHRSSRRQPDLEPWPRPRHRLRSKEWGSLNKEVRLVLKEYPDLKLTHGRKVLEIRSSINWDKGKALEFLLKSLGYAGRNDVFPIYIGDDRTDEDAFKVLRNIVQGIGILVSKFPKETASSYSLRDPDKVKEFLRKLVKYSECDVATKI